MDLLCHSAATLICPWVWEQSADRLKMHTEELPVQLFPVHGHGRDSIDGVRHLLSDGRGRG